MKKYIIVLIVLLIAVQGFSAVTPKQTYKRLDGNFSLPFAGTSAARDLVPTGVWVPRAGDWWWDTTNELLKVYNTAWEPYPSVSELDIAADGTAGVGPSPLVWDDSPLFDVILNPSGGYYFMTDCFEGDYTSAASLWTLTQRTSGTQVNSATIQGGAFTVDAAAATDAQGVTIQMHGITILPEAGTTIRIEWRMKIDEDAGLLMFGLGAVGTTDWVSDDTILVNVDSAVFFRDAGTGATDWSTQICDGSTVQSVDDVFTASTTGWETYAIVIVGNGAAATDSVTFYRNGIAASTVTDVADMPDAAMVPVFEVNADGTDQPVVDVDWIRILVSNSTDGSRS